MPLTEKGKKILKEFIKEYGEKEGKRRFYAAQNAGTITGTHRKRKKTIKRSRRGR